MLWACSIETMREQKHHTALSEPFGFGTHQVLVDYELCWVVKVTKLRLPQAEILGALKRVTVLIGHSTELIQVSVQYIEAALRVLLHKG